MVLQLNASYEEQKWNVSLYAVMLQCISTTANVCHTASKNRWQLHHISWEKKRKRFLFPLPSGEASLLWVKEDVKPCLTRWEQTRLLLINGSAWVLYIAVSIFSNLTCKTVRVCYIMQSTVEDVCPCFFSLLQHLLIIVGQTCFQ